MYLKRFHLCDIQFGSNFVLKHPFDLRKIRIYRVIEKKVKYLALKPVKDLAVSFDLVLSS